jgi:hypothetical protein|tara:strand:- start:344 stop:574 length:231 start_codon:yes stop_codon:yes gene_type:complete
MKKYNSCSIDIYDGKTYWHKAYPTLDEMYAHLKRYVHKTCDIIVYDISDAEQNGIKFVGLIKGYDSRKDSNEMLAL